MKDLELRLSIRMGVIGGAYTALLGALITLS
jgi:hypothetical protein